MDQAIDTIRIGGKLSDINPAEDWKISMEQTDGQLSEKARRSELAPGVNLFVFANETGLSGYIEGSVPRYINDNDSNWPAASISNVSTVAAEWLDLAGGHVEYRPEPTRVTRLDIVRDFELGDDLAAHDFLASHAVVPVDGRKTKAAYSDPTQAHAKTVSVRTRFSGGGRMYDKSKERSRRGVEIPAGILRFEAQERTKQLSAGGILDVGDLDLELAHALGAKRFSWCGFDRQLVETQELVAAILTDTRVKSWYKTRLALVGMVSLLESGAGTGSSPDRKEDYRLRKALATYGYPAKRTQRLDYVEGLVAA